MIVRISFTIKKPKEITEYDFMEWVRYNCLNISEISEENKMKNIDMEYFIKNIKHKVIKK